MTEAEKLGEEMAEPLVDKKALAAAAEELERLKTMVVEMQGTIGTKQQTIESQEATINDLSNQAQQSTIVEGLETQIVTLEENASGHEAAHASEVASLKGTIKGLETQIPDLKTAKLEVDSDNKALRSTHDKIAAQAMKIPKLEAVNEAQSTRISQLQADNDKVRGELATQKATTMALQGDLEKTKTSLKEERATSRRWQKLYSDLAGQHQSYKQAQEQQNKKSEKALSNAQKESENLRQQLETENKKASSLAQDHEGELWNLGFKLKEREQENLKLEVQLQNRQQDLKTQLSDMQSASAASISVLQGDLAKEKEARAVAEIKIQALEEELKKLKANAKPVPAGSALCSQCGTQVLRANSADVHPEAPPSTPTAPQSEPPRAAPPTISLPDNPAEQAAAESPQSATSSPLSSPPASSQSTSPPQAELSDDDNSSVLQGPSPSNEVDTQAEAPAPPPPTLSPNDASPSALQSSQVKETTPTASPSLGQDTFPKADKSQVEQASILQEPSSAAEPTKQAEIAAPEEPTPPLPPTDVVPQVASQPNVPPSERLSPLQGTPPPFEAPEEPYASVPRPTGPRSDNDSLFDGSSLDEESHDNIPNVDPSAPSPQVPESGPLTSLRDLRSALPNIEPEQAAPHASTEVPMETDQTNGQTAERVPADQHIELHQQQGESAIADIPLLSKAMGTANSPDVADASIKHTDHQPMDAEPTFDPPAQPLPPFTQPKVKPTSQDQAMEDCQPNGPSLQPFAPSAPQTSAAGGTSMDVDQQWDMRMASTLREYLQQPNPVPTQSQTEDVVEDQPMDMGEPASQPEHSSVPVPMDDYLYSQGLSQSAPVDSEQNMQAIEQATQPVPSSQGLNIPSTGPFVSGQARFWPKPITEQSQEVRAPQPTVSLSSEYRVLDESEARDLEFPVGDDMVEWQARLNAQYKYNPQPTPETQESLQSPPVDPVVNRGFNIPQNAQFGFDSGVPQTTTFEPSPQAHHNAQPTQVDSLRKNLVRKPRVTRPLTTEEQYEKEELFAMGHSDESDQQPAPVTRARPQPPPAQPVITRTKEEEKQLDDDLLRLAGESDDHSASQKQPSSVIIPPSESDEEPTGPRRILPKPSRRPRPAWYTPMKPVEIAPLPPTEEDPDQPMQSESTSGPGQESSHCLSSQLSGRASNGFGSGPAPSGGLLPTVPDLEPAKPIPGLQSSRPEQSSHGNSDEAAPQDHQMSLDPDAVQQPPHAGSRSSLPPPRTADEDIDPVPRALPVPPQQTSRTNTHLASSMLPLTQPTQGQPSPQQRSESLYNSDDPECDDRVKEENEFIYPDPDAHAQVPVPQKPVKSAPPAGPPTDNPANANHQLSRPSKRPAVGM